MTTTAGRAASAALLIGAAALASGCSSGRAGVADMLGLTWESPDPFNVYPREPLVLPEDLNALPEPQPGAPSPREPRPQAVAQSALGGAGAPIAEAGPSAAESEILALAGADSADPEIRAALEAEDQGRERKYGLTSLFGYKIPDGSEEELLEAREERRRLLEQGGAAPNPPPEEEPLPSNRLF